MPRKMKESGVEWLGQIPEGWGVRRNKYCYACGKEIVGSKSSDTTLLSLTTRGVKEKPAGAVGGKQPETFDTYQVVRPNDIVLCLFDLDCSAVFSGISHYDGMISPAYKVVSCKRFVCSQYAEYWFRFVSEGRKFKAYAKNLRYTLSYEEFETLPMLCPSLPEQQRISAFLDERCAKIDGMIAEAKASIEDYNIYRQDVIDCLANFGSCSINRVKVRDSGNVWLNKVPDAWDVLKIGLIFKEHCRAPKDEDIPLSLSQKDGLIPTDLMQEHSLKTSTYENWKRVLPDDLVLNRFKAHLGVFCASQYTGMVSFHYGVFVARRPLSVKYYEYLFHSTPYRRMFAELSNGITVGLQNLSNSSFYSARCVCPPIEDQRRIAEALDEKCAAIDKLVGEKEALIADLEAYKKSLIFEIVTGKREVA